MEYFDVDGIIAQLCDPNIDRIILGITADAYDDIVYHGEEVIDVIALIYVKSTNVYMICVFASHNEFDQFYSGNIYAHIENSDLQHTVISDKTVQLVSEEHYIHFKAIFSNNRMDYETFHIGSSMYEILLYMKKCNWTLPFICDFFLHT